MFAVRERQRPGVFFYLDNYSKVIPVGIPTLATGVFRQCLWTAQGILCPPYLEGFAEPDYGIRSGDPPLCTAIASDILRDILFSEYKAIDEDSRNLFSKSASRDVRTVPLTVLDSRGRSVRGDVPEPEFLPVGISPHNISSNLGLIRNLLELKTKHAELKAYIPLLSDVNIFRRVLRV